MEFAIFSGAFVKLENLFIYIAIAVKIDFGMRFANNFGEFGVLFFSTNE